MCMLSDVISGVRFGDETQNIGNNTKVEVLIFIPNDPYISVHKVSVDLSHSTRDRYRWWITDRRLR